MILALRAGRKTQTRRLLSLATDPDMEPVAYVLGGVITAEDEHGKPYRWPRTYAVGDRLWVREAWRTWSDDDHLSGKQICDIWAETSEGPEDVPNIEYLADHVVLPVPTVSWAPGRYRHGRFMPRAFSRMTQVVTDVRVQRLQDISDADAIAEGIHQTETGAWSAVDGYAPLAGVTPVGGYFCLWNAINLRDYHRWEDNPWVAAYTVETTFRNIDAVTAHG